MKPMLSRYFEVHSLRWLLLLLAPRIKYVNSNKDMLGTRMPLTKFEFGKRIRTIEARLFISITNLEEFK